MELWKWIVYGSHDLTGKYKVSSTGRVLSVARIAKNGKPIKERILASHDKTEKNCTTYKFVTLCNDGKILSVGIHRLVATAFIPNPNNLKCVNHIDGDGSNNSVENLEWCSHRDNILHSVYELGHNPRKWTAKGIAQKTLNGDVIRIWKCMSDAYREAGFYVSGISKAARRVNGDNVYKGCRWEFI